LTLDFVVAGVAGGAVFALWRGSAGGAGFLCACLWLALNTVLLARLLEAITVGQRAAAAFWLACAKIPLSYLVLYWLFQARFLDTWGLTAGILSLPVVLGFRGIAARQHHQVSEEGR
jgi:hypothetical protein